MTSATIKYILNLKGFKMNEWTNLCIGDENGIGVIGLLGDANICVVKFGKQFYFDSSANLLYIRNLQGNAAEEPDQWRTIPLVYKNKTYYFAPDGIAYNDPNIGYWNVCVSFDSIVGIYDKKHSVYLSY